MIGSFDRLREPSDMSEGTVDVFDDHIVVDGHSFTIEQIETVSVRTRYIGRYWKQTELVVDLVDNPEIVVPLASEAAADAAALIRALVERKIPGPTVPPIPAESGAVMAPELFAARVPRYREPLRSKLLTSENTILKFLTAAAVALLLFVVFESTRHTGTVHPVATHAPLPSPHAGGGPQPSTSPHPQAAGPGTRPSPSHHASPQPTHHPRTKHPHPKPTHTSHTSGGPTGGTTHVPTVGPPPPAPPPQPTSHPTPSSHPSPPAPHPSVTTHAPAPSPSIKLTTPPPKPSISISVPAPSPSISIGVLGLVRHVLAALARTG
jgi:hypothetical protein